jgi:hypothetical protein
MVAQNVIVVLFVIVIIDVDPITALTLLPCFGKVMESLRRGGSSSFAEQVRRLF